MPLLFNNGTVSISKSFWRYERGEPKMMKNCVVLLMMYDPLLPRTVEGLTSTN